MQYIFSYSQVKIFCTLNFPKVALCDCESISTMTISIFAFLLGPIATLCFHITPYLFCHADLLHTRNGGH